MERIVHRTCTLCEACCGIEVRVEDGRIAAIRGDARDPLSRGEICAKATALKDLHEDPDRLRHPIRRTGKGWERIGWDEALDEIAEALIDELTTRGGEGAILELGPNVGFGPNSAGPLRFFRLIGSPLTDSMAMIGDVAVGGTITIGTPHTDGTSDDWFRSEYLVLWAFNPGVTRIPDAHFLTEARFTMMQFFSQD